jgi:hypothetical protein
MFGRGKSTAKVLPVALPDERRMINLNRERTAMIKKGKELRKEIDAREQSIYNLSEAIPSMLQGIMTPKEIKMIYSHGEPYPQATDPASLKAIVDAENKNARRKTSLLSLPSSLPTILRGLTGVRVGMKNA